MYIKNTYIFYHYEVLIMNIEKLRYLVEVANCRSMTIAANNQFTTQSNISKTIKAVEEELNLSLFIRSKHGVEITEAGKVIVSHASAILAQLNAMYLFSLHHSTDNIMSGNLTIAYSPQIKYILSAAIASFKNVYSNVTLSVKEFTLENAPIEQWPSKIAADIYFFTNISIFSASDSGDFLDKSIHFLFSERISLATPLSWNLFPNKQSISLTDLSSVHLGCVQNNNSYPQPVLRLLQNDYNCSFSFIATDYDMLFQSVSSGTCCTLCTNSLIFNRQPDTIKIIPIQENLLASTYYYENNPEYADLAKSFLKILEIEIAQAKISSIICG